MAFTDFTSIAQVQETFDIKYVEEEYIRYDTTSGCLHLEF